MSAQEKLWSMGRGWVLVALVWVLACSGGAASEVSDWTADPPCVAGRLPLPDGRCQPAGLPPDLACRPGERSLPDRRCKAAGVPEDLACPPGQHALPDRSCRPAGVQAEICAAGRFEPDGQGGCIPILPDDGCPAGQMAVPGERACRDVAPCGEGRWNAAIPADATTEYVDQAYSGSDSDGSFEKPWKTVSEAVQEASPGAIVAIAAGRYDEELEVIGAPVRLWGLCPSQTVLVGSRRPAITIQGAGASGSEVRSLAVTGLDTGIVVQRARSVTLEEIRVHEAGYFGIVLWNRAGVTLRGSLIERNQEFGLYVEGSEATVETTVVRTTQAADSGAVGRGINVLPGLGTGDAARLWLTASLVEQNHEVGIFVIGSEAAIDATVVRANRPSRGDTFGWGVGVVRSPMGQGTSVEGKLSLTRSVVEENHETGVMVVGSVAEVASTVVRTTQPGGPVSIGWGLVVQPDMETRQQGSLSLKESLVDHNHDGGVVVMGSEATVESTVVRATQMTSTWKSGTGITILDTPETGDAARLLLTTSVVEDNHDTGVAIFGSDATIEATTVRATQMTSDGVGGRGVIAEQSPESGKRSTLLLKAARIEENHEIGVHVSGSDATIEDTTVRATQVTRGGKHGRGINVRSSERTGEKATLRLTGSLLEHNHDMGVFVEGSDVTIEDTVVRGTRSNGTGMFGRGINVQPNPTTHEKSQLWLKSSLVEDNREIGVFVAGSEATIESTVVRAIQPSEAYGAGRGIGVQFNAITGERAKLWLRSSLVEDNHEFGVFIVGSEAIVESTVVRATNAVPDTVEYGDGLAIIDFLEESDVTISATESFGNARAGVLYVASTGEISGVRSSGNRFGLVIDPGERDQLPTLSDSNVFEGNPDGDKIVGGPLSVPRDPLPPP